MLRLIDADPSNLRRLEALAARAAGEERRFRTLQITDDLARRKETFQLRRDWKKVS
jgi:hypothetical protein